MRSAIEELTQQFYAWELRGRGVLQWRQPVRLEPPFLPFEGHFVSAPLEHVDDGRHHTAMSKALAWISGETSQPALPPAPADSPEPDPELDLNGDYELAHLAIAMPHGTRVDRDAAEAFLLSLRAARGPIAFEVIGTPGAINIQWSARDADLPFLREQLRGHFPAAGVVESQDAIHRAWSPPGYLARVECVLAREFMLPLHTFGRSDPDPLIGPIAAMESLASDESSVLQILFEPAREEWAESVRRAVTDGEGGSFFLDAPAFARLAFEKVEHPLFAVVIRIATCSPVEGRATHLLRDLLGTLTQLGRSDGNELTIASNQYDLVLEEDVLSRRSHRSGMLLSSGELLALVHPPSASVVSSKLVRRMRQTRAAPERATAGIMLGVNEHTGQVAEIFLTPEERMRHMHVIGASGTGKSNLLLDLVLQIIAAREGVAVIDPHGDLVDEILARVPGDRDEDVVVFDAGDADHPVGFNLLAAHSEIERTLLSSDLVAIFRRLSTTWGDQMNAVLANAIQAFLTSSRGGSLADLRRFLIEQDFRREFLATVNDEEVVYYWSKEFPLLVGKPAGPILTRLDGFLRPKPLRAMLAQRENRLDFREIIDHGRILLVKLAQGAIGEENSALLGSLMVAKLHQAAMSRQDTARESRREFTLVVDEFQEVVTPSVARILAGTRKYRLGLVAAHQAMRPVFEADPAVASALLANAATRVVFRVGEDDARKLAEGFAHFEAEDLTSLGIGEGICRVNRADHDFNLRTRLVAQIDPETAGRRREELVARSRAKFASKPNNQIPIERVSAPPNKPPVQDEEAPKSDPERLRGLLGSVQPKPRGPK
jgi:hypothetical protein